MWKFFDLAGGGSITPGLVVDYTGLNLAPLLSGSFNASTGVFSIVGAVPEPSRAVLVLLGLAGVMVRRRRIARSGTF